MTVHFTVVWTDTAIDDLLAIVDYSVDHHGVDAAGDVSERITAAVRGLGSMPRRCRIVPELDVEGITGYRELIVGPYRIMVAIREGTVVVLTVLDGRRDLAELVVERAFRENR